MNAGPAYVFRPSIGTEPPTTAMRGAICHALGGCLSHPTDPRWCLYCQRDLHNQETAA